jgi:4-hydroxy-tetrahydrodipicolinate synthase
VIPALAVPFREDYKIDEEGLARFCRSLAGCLGVTALMANGHTGEVGSLLPEERADVTRIVADAVAVLLPAAEEMAAMRAALEASGVPRVDLV